MSRTNFNSSRLTRFLADLAVVDAPNQGHAFAERLGLWLDFKDAITLFAAHDVINKAADAGASGANLVAAEGEFVRVRTALAESIRKSCTPNGGSTRLKLPTPTLGVPIEIVASYEPYRRFYLAHQREMELAIRPLRAQVREALLQASPALRQLATLDAALDEILSDRESRLLATVPSLLQRRHEQLLKAHQQMLVDTGRTDDPAEWMRPGAWLAGFCQELQTALLAELDVRLQPTTGLIEAGREHAVNNEVKKYQ